MDSTQKNVLIVSYSQTGQLSRVVQSFAAPLVDASNVAVTFLEIEPVEPYPFPWPFLDFFDVFPETVYLEPPAIKPLDVPADTPFDLVVVAYQVWFLSPSPPITAFLQSGAGRQLIKDRPVVTLIACRNMWVMAQETVKGLLEQAQAQLVDNVVLTDQSSALASFITTPRWMFTGRRNAFWGLPAAGVAEDRVAGARRFGAAILRALDAGEESTGGPLLSGLQAVAVNGALVQSERTGYRGFRIWGKLLRKVGSRGDPARKPVLLVYFLFLVAMIVTVVPITMLIRFVAQLIATDRREDKYDVYELPSGSGDERMDEFNVCP